LVVDDDKSMRMLLRLALEQEGYQMLEAQDGEACLATYQHCQPTRCWMRTSHGWLCLLQPIATFPGERTPVLMVQCLTIRCG